MHIRTYILKLSLTKFLNSNHIRANNIEDLLVGIAIGRRGRKTCTRTIWRLKDKKATHQSNCIKRSLAHLNASHSPWRHNRTSSSGLCEALKSRPTKIGAKLETGWDLQGNTHLHYRLSLQIFPLRINWYLKRKWLIYGPRCPDKAPSKGARRRYQRQQERFLRK